MDDPCGDLGSVTGEEGRVIRSGATRGARHPSLLESTPRLALGGYWWPQGLAQPRDRVRERTPSVSTATARILQVPSVAPCSARMASSGVSVRTMTVGPAPEITVGKPWARIVDMS